jgi:NADPH-dependent glutamate synthase beta subunit-like oxidoreductase/ferredoxin
VIKLKIDNINIELPEGTTVLEAARSQGIQIPTMCHHKGHHNHPTCMVCLVKNRQNGQLFPSCATKITEGMDVISEDHEVVEARREAIELLLSDHVGDCEAPCRVACPAFMDIPKMNRLIAQEKYTEAAKIVRQEIALPGILGSICSAPCEKVCRRKDMENPLAICQLKAFTAQYSTSFSRKERKQQKIAIIGAGIAGLSAAYHLLLEGYSCDLFEKETYAGGSVYTEINKGNLQQEIFDRDLQVVKDLGANFYLNTEVNTAKFSALQKEYDSILIASGGFLPDFHLKGDEKGFWVSKENYQSEQKAIFICGSAVRKQKMAVKALAMGKEAAYSIGQYLQKGEAKPVHRKFNSRFGTLRKEELGEYLKESYEAERSLQKQMFTSEEAIAEAKRCLHCDCRKLDNCKLRDCADTYQADRRRFAFGDRNSVMKDFTHEKIVFESEKCIKCGLCIEIAEQNQEQTGMTNIGRGFTGKVAIPFQQEVKKALQKVAVQCAQACPTGAIAMKEENDEL